MMNERIRELIAESTWVQFAEGVGYKEVFDKEKFAELIVRECMTLVEGFESTQEVALDEYVDYEASAVLKEHFGVQE